jgi:hypothetical protein
MVCVCVWNLPCGHDRHVDGRHYQLRAATADFFKTQVPGYSVLWQVFGCYIYSELEALGVEFQGDMLGSIGTLTTVRNRTKLHVVHAC